MSISYRNALVQAKRRVSRAEEECPHWDYGSQPDPMAHECCAELYTAQLAVRASRRALDAYEQP